MYMREPNIFHPPAKNPRAHKQPVCAGEKNDKAHRFTIPVTDGGLAFSSEANKDLLGIGREKSALGLVLTMFAFHSSCVARPRDETQLRLF
jgi:hypothetical protein